ncbi:MAG: methyltransferase [Pseudomonadota bacterium]
MSDTAQAARFWDRAAPKYAKDPIADMASYNYTLERTKSYLSAEDRVVELGAGTSSTALELAPMVANYLSTDVSSEMVRIGRDKAASSRVSSLQVEVATPASLASRGDQYDAVLALNLLHLLPDVPAALADVAKLTRAGGLFISKTGCLGSAPVFKRAFFSVMIAAMSLIGKAPGTVQYLRVEELDAQIEAAGFEIIESALDMGDVPRRYIVARKRT